MSAPITGPSRSNPRALFSASPNTPRAGLRLLRLASLCAALACAGTGLAQTYPSKPVRIVVPTEVGTPTDTTARAVGQSLAQALGQPFIAENRPGANGIIGMEACVKAPPDGYNLCIANGAPVTLNPFIYPKLSYDPPRDLAPVILIGSISACIVVNAKLPVNSMKELFDLAKSRPNGVEWGSWGSGSFSHLYLAWAQDYAGTVFHHVPYKTPGQATTALVSGEIDVLLNTPALMAPLAKAGKLRVIAITGTRRVAVLPEVSTFKEQGLDLDYLGWTGVFVPTGTPRPIIDRLNAEIAKLIADPDFAEKFLRRASVDPGGGSPEEFAAFLRKDRETSALLVRLAAKVQ